MSDHSGSARFQELFESALQAYERMTGITLAQHALAVDLQSCHPSARLSAFSDFRERDRMMKAIKTTVAILTPVSDAPSLADSVGLVRHKALKACSTSPTFFLDIIPTCESNTGWSRYTAGCMCRSLVHM